jgi:hypothetical protein
MLNITHGSILQLQLQLQLHGFTMGHGVLGMEKERKKVSTEPKSLLN